MLSSLVPHAYITQLNTLKPSYPTLIFCFIFACSTFSCTSSIYMITQQKCVAVFLEYMVLLDFSLTVKAAPHEWVIRTSQP